MAQFIPKIGLWCEVDKVCRKHSTVAGLYLVVAEVNANPDHLKVNAKLWVLRNEADAKTCSEALEQLRSGERLEHSLKRDFKKSNSPGWWASQYR
jgi:hypothetical protein